MIRSYRPTSNRAVLILGAIALGSCTMIGAPSTAPSPSGRSPQPPPAIASTRGTAPATGRTLGGAERITSGVVDLAVEAIGTPYRWGGTSENGFDCSGLIQYAYGQFGIALPRVSHEQMRVGSAVSPVRVRLREGDVLGFSESRAGRATHVGLYIGDGRFIHSSSSGVRISSLDNAYWRQSLVAARRIVG